MEQVVGAEPVPAQQRHLVGFAHGAQHRIAGAAAHVGGQADAHRARRVAEARGVEQAGAEEGVGGGAVHHGGAGGRQQRALPLRQVDAVREQAARAEQAIAVVHVGVVPGPRKVAPHRGDLRPALGEVAVHVAIGVARGQFAGGAELRHAGSDREPHRDGVAQPPAAVPAFDQRRAVPGAALRRVAQLRGRVAIHHRLAGHQRQAAPFGGGQERLGRPAVHRGEHHRGGGAVLRQPVEEHLRGGARVRGRGVAAFLREGEALQPVEQVAAGSGQHAVLRKVDVRVDQAGQHQRRPVVVHRQRAEPLRQPRRGPAPSDAAGAVHGDRAAAVEQHRAPRRGGGGVGAVGQHRALHHPPANAGAHGATRSSRRNRRMRSTLARANARSVAGEWLIRSSNAARIAVLAAPFTAKMNGNPNRLR